MFKRLSRFIGSLLLLEGLLMFVCAYVDLLDGHNAWRGFAFGAMGATFSGIIFTIAGYAIRSRVDAYGVSKSHTMFSIGWLVSIPFGIIPFLLDIPGINLSGAVLELTSALTTVGLTFYLRGENISRGLLLWHTLLAGVGGVGVIILSCLLMSGDEADSLSHFARAEFGTESGLSASSPAGSTAMRILLIYLGTMIACGMSYKLFGMSWWDAACTSIATVSTSGFVHRPDIHQVLFNDNLMFTAAIFMVLSSMPLILLANAVASVSPRSLFRSEQVRVFVFLLFGLVCLVCYKVSRCYGFLDSHLISLSTFHTVSAMTTTGFSNLSLFRNMPSVYGILFLITIFGGCVGSTTGGLKILRLIISFKSVGKFLRHKVVRSSVSVVKVNDVAVGNDVTQDALLFIFLYATTYFASVLAILCCRGIGLAGASGLAFSLVTTSGIGGSEVLSLFDKEGLVVTQLLSSAIMMVGRLELISFYTLLSRRVWESR